MTVAMWGGGSPTDLADRIKTGDVALDFYRPVGILGWYLAADVGPRGVPPAQPRAGADPGRGASSSTCATRPGRWCGWRSS